jgi:membrane-associated phospholipid phosphatase
MKLFFLSLLFSFFSSSLFSWELKDSKEKFLSPLKEKKAQKILLAGSLATTVLVFNRPGLVYPLQHRVATDQPLGKWNHFGDNLGLGVPQLFYVAGMWWHGTKQEDALSLKRRDYMIDSTLYAIATTTVLKEIFQRPRPDRSDYRSFPSGHTTMAFSFATAVLMEHGLGWGIPALAMASFVGYSRINDNKHYLDDVVMGATIGSVFAVGLHSYYQKQNKKLTILPLISPDQTVGLQATLVF